jgi:hypothetical protein
MLRKINPVPFCQGSGIALFLVTVLRLAGVPIEVSLKAVTVTAIQIVSGAFIYSLIPRSRPPTIPEYLGMGFAIGSALSTLSDIFLKSTRISSFAWLVPTFVVVIVIATQNLKSKHGVVTRIQETTFEFVDILPILVISFLYLALDFVWYISLFASGLCVLIAINLKGRSKSSRIYLRSVIGLTAFATASLLAGIQYRIPLWWINSDDYQFFESLQISLARYGPRDHLGASGTSITNYHFLPYAWTGLLDRVSSASTWIILNRVTPVIVSVIVSALVWSYLSREGVHGTKSRFLLACLYPILLAFTFGSPSSAIGIIYLLAGLFYWSDHRITNFHWSRILLGTLFTVFIIGTKTSNGPTIILGLGALAIIGIIRNRLLRFISLADLIIATVTGALYYLLLLRNSTIATLVEVEPFGFAKQIFGDLNELNGRSLFLIGGITSSTFIIIPFLGTILFWSKKQFRSSQLGYLALPIFPLLLMYVLIIGGHGSSARYFVNSALSILLLIVLIAVSGSLQMNERSHQGSFRFNFFCITGLVAGLATSVVLEHLQSGGRTAMLGRAIASAPWILVVLIGIFYFAHDIRNLKHTKRLMTLLSLVLVGVISANATVFTIDLYRVARQPELSASNVDSIIGTPDEKAAGVWIDFNLPVDAIIASNHFCGPKECFGADWFNVQVTNFEENPKYLIEKCPNCEFTLFGGSNFTLPAYSKRRFLIQGPRFLWGLSNPPSWAIDRMNATLGFANSPSKETLTELRNFEVEYFIVDLASTAQRTWSPFGILLYRNQSFAILRLTDVL